MKKFKKKRLIIWKSIFISKTHYLNKSIKLDDIPNTDDDIDLRVIESRRNIIYVVEKNQSYTFSISTDLSDDEFFWCIGKNHVSWFVSAI